MNIFSANLDDCLQPNMMRPSEIHSRREKFEEEYAKKGFMYVYFKYGEEGWRYKLRVFLRRIKRCVTIILKKNNG